MNRVKIKSRTPPTKDRKIELLEILFRNQIQITRVFNANDGFVVLSYNDEHSDKIFSKGIKEILDKNGFSPILPPELKVKKSVIVSRVDYLVYDWGETDIVEELKAKNPWAEDGIESVFKFSNSTTLKITFSQSSLANKCLQNGILAFNISIPPTEIRQETYIPIKCCMKCYHLEDHFTKECPKDREYKVCSECSMEGHLWHQCQEQTKKCINCGENHSSLAMKCIKRKEILKEKRREEKEKQNMTYAGITRSGNNPIPTNVQPIIPQITKEEVLKINICVSHARSKNIENPGCYSEELNKILKANNLPNIIIPEETSPDQVEDVQVREMAPPPIKERKVKGAEKESVGRKDTEEKDIETEIGKLEQLIYPLEAKNIGLQFFTSRDRGWPERNFTVKDLIQGMRQNKFKWTYNESKFSEEKIMDMIIKEEIDLNNCWNIVEKDNFRKIRSGLQQDRSPLSRDPRTRKHSQ